MTLERALARSLKKKPPAAPKSRQKDGERPQHLILGERGEGMAVEYLRAKGYAILQRNVRFPYGEIDIVTRFKDEIVFVEVRTRTIGKILPADCTVGPNKLRKLTACAEAWADSRSYRGFMRIDLIAITIDKEKHVKIEHIENITEAIS